MRSRPSWQSCYRSRASWPVDYRGLLGRPPRTRLRCRRTCSACAVSEQLLVEGFADHAISEGRHVAAARVAEVKHLGDIGCGSFATEVCLDQASKVFCQ